MHEALLSDNKRLFYGLAEMKKKKNGVLTLRDILSHLSYADACSLLGPKAKQLLASHSAFDVDLRRNVRFTADSFKMSFKPVSRASVTIQTSVQKKSTLSFDCSQCKTVCDHVGAAVSLILEEKVALGLAAPPDPIEQTEVLSDEALVERELAARQKRADDEKMSVRAVDPKKPWTDYRVRSKLSGKTYRVALRGLQRGESYCNCPDFRKNTLGTCKHIIKVQARAKRNFSTRKLATVAKIPETLVHLSYGDDVDLRLQAPIRCDAKHQALIKPFVDKPIRNISKLLKAIAELEASGIPVTIYPDAEEYIQQHCIDARIKRRLSKIESSGADHPLRSELLKTPLLPYQWQGVLFAVGAGRSILADDMGLGKTIQGIGTAELLAQVAAISRVLVICPASLKSQWRSEIERFCDRDVQLIAGAAAERQSQYDNNSFFTVCNYEQVLRDVLCIERVGWDLIILDEGHRIKNWETKTSRVIKSLKSPFALVLSGTPMENRLDELYSVAEFIDERRLGPGFRFYHQHRVTDEKGKLTGYRNLSELREKLKPILLRRTRSEVLDELPPRTTEFIRITPTEEQLQMHSAHMVTVASIIGKPYLTEMDLLRLQKALLMCRMTADSTMLVDKQSPGYSSKLEVLGELIAELSQQTDRKTVLFSEWTTMLGLIEELFKQHGVGFVRLDGKVPQGKRSALVQQFKDDPACQFFITTNAGSTGLNLQFANTVINVDLPWTPALLEQRIARVHRMGQQSPVQAYVLITENTLEENLLATLAAKQELSLAALDSQSNIDELDLTSGIDGLKQKLEVLLGAKPEAPVDESQRQQTESQQALIERRERVALAGGQMLSSAFEFIGELLPQAKSTKQTEALAESLRNSLSECVEKSADGGLVLSVKLKDEDALSKLAQAVAQMVADPVQ